jgi:histidine triad (HIT) family protein
LYQTDSLVVFKDINPHARVHLLIVPRKHIRSVNDLTAADSTIIAEMLMAAKEIARRQSVAQSGYRVFINVERGGGQLIFHLHMHLVAN